MDTFTFPPGYARIKLVQSFAELVAARLEDGVNAVCWPRQLAGDFAEIVAKLGVIEGIASLEPDRLRALPLSPAGAAAREIMLEDFALLQAQGLAPVLDCIEAYPRDDASEAVPTHVYSFHADLAPVPAETYLCTYFGRASEGLRNEDAVRRIDVPATRAELLQQYGGEDDATFSAYLSDACYDLHYAAKPGAQPFSFGVGNLWRIAIEWPGNPVPPCVHRAPDTLAADSPRLLLIS